MSLTNQDLVGINNKVIVSFTTVSSRINYIEPMVNSILNQTMQPDSFELYISDHPSLFKNGFDRGIPYDKIPQFLLDLSEQGKLKIKYVPNIGPANKLIPALRENKHTNNVIITVDDDQVYANNLISLLLHGYHRYNSPVAIVAAKPKLNRTGKLLSYNRWANITRQGKYRRALIKGVGGALYKASFFHHKIFNTRKLLNLSAKNDDVWFHFMRLAKKIPVFVISRPLPTPLSTLPKGINRLLYSNVFKRQNNKWIKNVAKFTHVNLNGQKKAKKKRFKRLKSKLRFKNNTTTKMTAFRRYKRIKRRVKLR